jgi:hypothetical protein
LDLILKKSHALPKPPMSEIRRRGLARLLAQGVAQYRYFVRPIFDAIQHAHDRKAPRDAEDYAGFFGDKLTDETERKMMEHLMRDRNFKP